MPGGLDDRLNNPNFRQKLLRRIEEGWTFDKIEPMSTEEIFVRLNRLGVTVASEDFRQAAQGQESAERLADEWYGQYILRPEGRYDEDFVWMAAIVLWKRLIPDRVCFEQIDEQMQTGYELSETGRIAEACDTWWQVWEWLREKVTPERSTLETLDRHFRGSQFIFNWCQDFEQELENAGADDPEYHRLRVRYCQEFLETFVDVAWLMRGNFLRAEAESHWRLGEVDTAEARFEALIEANPDWPWGYVGWSDEYWLFRDSPKDYDRAEEVLQRALERPNLEDRDVVVERLESLRAERAQAAGGKRRKRRLRQRRH
jgi:tetratricopeptide (TPR) repeat protein